MTKASQPAALAVQLRRQRGNPAAKHDASAAIGQKASDDKSADFIRTPPLGFTCSTHPVACRIRALVTHRIFRVGMKPYISERCKSVTPAALCDRIDIEPRKELLPPRLQSKAAAKLFYHSYSFLCMQYRLPQDSPETDQASLFTSSPNGSVALIGSFLIKKLAIGSTDLHRSPVLLIASNPLSPIGSLFGQKPS